MLLDKENALRSLGPRRQIPERAYNASVYTGKLS